MMRSSIYDFVTCNLQDTINIRHDTIPGPGITGETNVKYPHSRQDLDTINMSHHESITDSMVLLPSIAPEGNYRDSIMQQGRILFPHKYFLESKIDSVYNQDIPYLFSDSSDYYIQKNILENSGNQYYIVRDQALLIYKEGLHKQEPKMLTEYSQEQVKNKHVNIDINPDWLIGIIIISLIVLAWLKLFYNKFIDQTFTSLWNFQLAAKTMRNQNLFSRRIALILNLNFVVIIGLFVYLVLAHFNINPYNLKPPTAYIFYSSIVAILLFIRYFITLLLAHIFNQQDLFRGYLHQLLLIYKNLGVIFIPLILCIAYIQDKVRIYLIIIGIILFILAYLFRFIKGAQLIIKKDVLIFYLILYLCTLEILPVLICFKLFSSWI